MTEEKLRCVIELYNKIEEKKAKLKNIDFIMKSRDLNCTIIGNHSIGLQKVYSFYNKDEIIRILQIQKDILLDELEYLEKFYSGL